MARTLLAIGMVVTGRRELLAIIAGAMIASTQVGCGGEASTTGDIESSPELRVTKGPAPFAARKAPVCDTPSPLLVHHDEHGRVDRLHATLTARDMTGYYLVDTGSSRSFVTYSAAEETDWAKTKIGCASTSLPIIARLRPGSTPNGDAQAGVLGSDLLAHGSVLDLDLKRETLGWYSPAPKIPENAVVLPIEWRNGWLIASGIVLDGKPVKLVVDTGSTNIIWLDGTPRPNEVREDTVDGTANPVVLYHGAGLVSFAGGDPLAVPVDRTDEFATLKGLVMSLGGDVHGLLGMTALGRDRVILSRDRLAVVLPVPPK
ncbi:MAG: hypothetical protein JST00_09300 [Deltaproteobacteria bacterium]|nr:hypothetical protein [Deltaproteobacteria bacterium]